jgi:hypothetical protein
MIRVVHPGSRIRMLTFSHPGSRIQGSKRHPIPDPDPQHWLHRVTGDMVTRHMKEQYKQHSMKTQMKDRCKNRLTRGVTCLMTEQGVLINQMNEQRDH